MSLFPASLMYVLDSLPVSRLCYILISLFSLLLFRALFFFSWFPFFYCTGYGFNTSLCVASLFPPRHSLSFQPQSVYPPTHTHPHRFHTIANFRCDRNASFCRAYILLIMMYYLITTQRYSYEQTTIGKPQRPSVCEAAMCALLERSIKA